MTGGFAEAQDELRAVARDLLAKAPAPAWSRLADAGWLGLEVPGALEGAGAGFAEVAVVLEEMGRAATTGPYFGTVVLGVGALNLLEPHPARDALLRLVALGERTVAVALPTGSGHWISLQSDISSAQNGGFRIADGRLSGRAELVIDAPGADRLLLPALTPDAGPVVVVVHGGAEAPAGLDVAAVPVLDATRRLGTVTTDGVEVNSAAVWRFAGDPGASGARSARSRRSSTPAPTCLSGCRWAASWWRPLSRASWPTTRTPGWPWPWRSRTCAVRRSTSPARPSICTGHRLHVGGRHPRLPQAGRARPLAVRLAGRPPEATCGPPRATVVVSVRLHLCPPGR